MNQTRGQALACAGFSIDGNGNQREGGSEQVFHGLPHDGGTPCEHGEQFLIGLMPLLSLGCKDPFKQEIPFLFRRDVPDQREIGLFSVDPDDVGP